MHMHHGANSANLPPVFGDDRPARMVVARTQDKDVDLLN
jgi:hypothetical protein